MILQQFKKCGIATNVDGFEDYQVKNRRLEDYVMPATV